MFESDFGQIIIEKAKKNGAFKRVPIMSISYFVDDFCKRKYVGFNNIESLMGSVQDTSEYCFNTIFGKPIRVMEPAIFYID